MLVHTWEIDRRSELYGRWLVGIVCIAMHVDAIDTVLVYALDIRQHGRISLVSSISGHHSKSYMWWSKYSAVPIRHQ